MKKIPMLFCALLAVTLIAGPALAKNKSSIELGNTLFNDPALGGSTNDKSCGSCHPGGEGLEKAGSRKDLGTMINRCVVGALKGSKIDGRSAEMLSLKKYIESLGH